MTVVAVHPELAAHGSFEHLPLGRQPSRRDPRNLLLARYLDEATVLPTVPAATDYSAKVTAWGMMENDSLGDCTCAAAGHLTQAWTAETGHETDPPDSAVARFYWETGDPPAATGQPGGPTDTGRVETDVLNYWRRHSLGGHRISAYAACDVKRPDLLRAGLYLFGGLYLGLELPLSAQTQHVWDLVGDGRTGPSQPGSWGGHAVAAVAYDAGGLTVVTWGALMRMTWRFAAVYLDEAYAVLAPEWLKHGRTPDGFNREQLDADLTAVTG